jgi:hypothetical protein
MFWQRHLETQNIFFFRDTYVVSCETAHKCDPQTRSILRTTSDFHLRQSQAEVAGIVNFNYRENFNGIFVQQNDFGPLHWGRKRDSISITLISLVLFSFVIQTMITI